MQVPTEELRSAFEVVDAVPANPAMESSTFVRMKLSGTELTLNLTGLMRAQAFAKCTNDTSKWTVFVDRRTLNAFLSTVSKDTIEVFYAKDKLTLRADQRLEVPAHAPISGYETSETSKLFSLPDELRTALKTAVKYLPSVAGSEHLDAIRLQLSNDRVLAVTDSLFMFIVLDDPKSLPACFLPASLSKVIAQNPDKQLFQDKNGVGIVFTNGIIYQPVSSELDRFPIDASVSTSKAAIKSMAYASTTAGELKSVLATASQFLMDSIDTADVSVAKGKLLVTVDAPTGKFQKPIATKGEATLKDTNQWSVRKLLPWVEYICSVDNDIEVECVRVMVNGASANASAFRCTKDSTKYVLIFADI